jgi:hypothetical protein
MSHDRRAEAFQSAQNACPIGGAENRDFRAASTKGRHHVIGLWYVG